MMSTAPSSVDMRVSFAPLIVSDFAGERSGSSAVQAFADENPWAVPGLQAVLGSHRGFDVVRFVTEQGSYVLRLRPSADLQRVIRFYGGQRSVERILAAYGFDLDLRAAA